jgi:hypothetical protein
MQMCKFQMGGWPVSLSSRAIVKDLFNAMQFANKLYNLTVKYGDACGPGFPLQLLIPRR